MAANVDSEMEEGEIVDDLDELSDISSEEEFLLRQRLEVLENYNNVLERKKAKRTSVGTGVRNSKEVLCDLSEISTSEFDDAYVHTKNIRHRHNKCRRPKRSKDLFIEHNNVRKKRDTRKKYCRSKRKLGVKVISESSEESEDEYRNKRKKLADAVNRVNGDKSKNDTSSLSDRLKKMLHQKTKDSVVPTEVPLNTTDISNNNRATVECNETKISQTKVLLEKPPEITKETDKCLDAIEISTDEDDDEDEIKMVNEEGTDVVDGYARKEKVRSAEESEEDLELLRQHALNTKTAKSKTKEIENKLNSEDEDSDTAELRLICLKSALLKKAIEMKQKQRLQKRLSQSNLEDDLFNSCGIFTERVEIDNNTDTESVDMEIGSDGEGKIKDCTEEVQKVDNSTNIDKSNTAKEDELDEDEDLLRAKLLTSLSKNLPNLVNPELLDELSNEKEIVKPKLSAPKVDVPEKKRFIIKLDESDSEDEHEATENLTKMHMKLSEQIDFQQKLDIFLKSTRMEVEKTKLPDVVQQQPAQKKPEKYVAKAVNHLPKSEQIEYKNLVKRMAELEKIKQSRQAAMNMVNQNLFAKETLKPRNVTIDSSRTINNIEEQITLSRKKIAEESAKILKLKEEATKLSQKYKIAATELRNISTAITLNKKQQRSVHNCLAKIRLQHQTLLRSSTNMLHSKLNGRTNINNTANRTLSINKLQKENNPKDDYKNVFNQKTVKVSVVNDVKENANNKLSVHVDVLNNKKTVVLPKSPDTDSNIILNDNERERLEFLNKSTTDLPIEEKRYTNTHSRRMSSSDYISPLASIGTTTWKADPNAILCPFEVGGQCKDTACKYLHTDTQ